MRKKWLPRWKLLEVADGGRRAKGAAQGREVAEAALELLVRKPDLSRKDCLDVLIARFEGTASVKLDTGQRRSSRDPVYRKARARIERRLTRGFELLGRPEQLAQLS